MWLHSKLWQLHITIQDICIYFDFANNFNTRFTSVSRLRLKALKKEDITRRTVMPVWRYQISHTFWQKFTGKIKQKGKCPNTFTSQWQIATRTIYHRLQCTLTYISIIIDEKDRSVNTTNILHIVKHWHTFKSLFCMVPYLFCDVIK